MFLALKLTGKAKQWNKFETCWFCKSKEELFSSHQYCSDRKALLYPLGSLSLQKPFRKYNKQFCQSFGEIWIFFKTKHLKLKNLNKENKGQSSSRTCFISVQ